MIVDELVARLVYQIGGQGNLKKFQKDIDQTQRQVVAAGAAMARAAAAAGAALAGLAAGVFAKGVIDTGSTFEKLGVQLEALEGSAAKAQKAMGWIKEFAKATPLQLEGVVKGYAALRNYGIDPTNGSFQAMVDTMAKQGKGQQELEQIIRGVGQAWLKEKLQGEEAMQLIEAGVPAYRMLGTAMGKTAAQIQAMAEKGKLGRKHIALLIKQMGKESAGASAKMAKTFDGLTSAIDDSWTEVKQGIADGGFFDAVKDQLDRVRVALEAWSKSGGMKRAGDVIGGFMASVVRGMARVGDLIRDGIAKAGPKVKQAWETVSGMVMAGDWFGLGQGLATRITRGFGALGAFIKEKIATGDTAADLLEAGKDIIKKIMFSWYDFVTGFWGTIGQAMYEAGNWTQTGKDMGRELVDGILSMFPDWLVKRLGYGGKSTGPTGGLSGDGYGGDPYASPGGPSRFETGPGGAAFGSGRGPHRNLRYGRGTADDGGLPTGEPLAGGADTMAGPAVIGRSREEHAIRPHQAAVAQEAYNFYRGKGMSREATLGILANIQNESAYDPRARGDNGASHGLYQHQSPRRRAIQAATGINMSTASSLDQHKGAWHELTAGTDAGAREAYRLLKRPGITAAEAAAIWSRKFERPAKDHGAYRGNVARSLERQIGERSTSAVAGSGVTRPAVDPDRYQPNSSFDTGRRAVDPDRFQTNFDTGRRPVDPDRTRRAVAPHPVVENLRANLDRINGLGAAERLGQTVNRNTTSNSSASTTNNTVGDIHLHGIQEPKQLASKLSRHFGDGAAPRPARMQASPVA